MTKLTDVPLELDVEAIRRDFPVLTGSAASGAPLIYLDNAASTQHPLAVIEAMDDCYRHYYANVHRGIHTLSEQSTRAFEAARLVTAHFLGAAPTETIFTSGTTAGINLVARSWGDANLGPGDRILLTIAEHHANIVPWQQLAERTGGELVYLPITDQGLIDDAVVQQYLEQYRPKLFAFTALSNVLGAENPVARWVTFARQVGAVVLVDAAQAVPHLPVDVRQWDADFVVFSAHKLCGPSGIGVLYGKEAILEAMPPFLGGGAMIRTVSTTGFVPGQLPQKFEAGTPPIVEAIGMAAAIGYIGKLGLENIYRHERRLVRVAYEALAQVPGVKMFGPAADQRAGLISFVIEGVHPHDVSQWLDTRGIAIRAGHHCTMPLHERLGATATCRASFYLYNTLSEAEALGEAVAEVQRKFARPRRR